MTENSPSIVLFDGVCNFCSASVNWIIRRDKRARFRFAPLQSATGERLQREHGLDPSAIDTMLLVDDGRAYLRSSAALRIVRDLSFPWPLLYAFIIVPAPIRDFFYTAFANRRYRWFGKKDDCMVPSQRVRDRFLID
jgi:predicted DCC family thiol-disulfide oxidoreductase YuxK